MTQSARPLNETAATWLEARGIDLEVAVKEGLFSASPAGSGQGMKPDANGRWIGIPSIVDGRQIGCKYRYTQDKRWMQDKGSEQQFYRRDSIRGEKTIIITEGELDAVSAVQAGYNAVCSVPGGAPQETGQKAHGYFDEAFDDLQAADKIILAFDSDGPGAALFEDAKVILGAARSYFVNYPPGCKDLNDVLSKFGAEVVHKVIDTAKPVPVSGLVRPSDLPELPPLDVYRAGLSSDFDHHVGICLRQTSVWTGFANHGKSTLIKQVMTSLAKRYNWPVCSAAIEDDLQRDFKKDILRAWSGLHPSNVSDEDMARFNQFYERQFLLVNPEDLEEITLDRLFDIFETAVVRHGVKFLVIDPFTEIDLQLSGRQTERDAIGDALKAFNRFARRYNCHIAIVAHPSKPGTNGEKYPPLGYDISGAAHWKNKPYLGVTCHKDPDVADIAQVVVWKSKRVDPMGPTGTFYMRYSREAGVYFDMPKSEYQLLKDGDIT